MKLANNFTLSEFTNSRTARKYNIDNSPTEEHLLNLAVVANALQSIRDKFGMPVKISSGYRSEELNRRIGGAKTSSHMKGEAVDFEIVGVDNFAVFKFVKAVMDFDQVILEGYTPGRINSGWIHLAVKRIGDNRNQALMIKDGKTIRC